MSQVKPVLLDPETEREWEGGFHSTVLFSIVRFAFLHYCAFSPMCTYFDSLHYSLCFSPLCCVLFLHCAGIHIHSESRV